MELIPSKKASLSFWAILSLNANRSLGCICVCWFGGEAIVVVASSTVFWFVVKSKACITAPFCLWHFTKVNKVHSGVLVLEYIRLVKIHRVVTIFLKNMFKHSTQGCLVFLKFVMGVCSIEFGSASRLKVTRVNCLVLLRHLFLSLWCKQLIVNSRFVWWGRLVNVVNI